MRIISLNVNGIRAAQKKGMFEWLSSQDADVICLQEVRADASILEDTLYQLPKYHSYYQSAEKKGYSGVGILSKKKPDKVIRSLGFPLADTEGRYIHAEFGNLVVASLYLPSGTSGEVRQDQKYVFLDAYLSILKKQIASKRSYIICGDWNIAHKEIDLKNWKTNQKNSGFLPEERAWLDKLFDNVGFVDAFRVVNLEPDNYTWWSNRRRVAF
ncbi:MAG: exodeoxyribonuclease III [Candidatus Berkiella sp.]